jgi:hypothetical protein
MDENPATARRDQIQDNDAHADLVSGHDVNDDGMLVDRRKCKQRKREAHAFEWLQSVQENKHVLAEAASSQVSHWSYGIQRPLAAAKRRKQRARCCCEQCHRCWCSKTPCVSGFAQNCDTDHAPMACVILVGGCWHRSMQVVSSYQVVSRC